MRQITDVAAFPVGSKILHIGPPKTGTSTLQSALHVGRERNAELGVYYGSKGRHDRSAAMAVSFDPIPPGFPADAPKRWKGLARRFRESDAPRRFLSSETLSHAEGDQIERIVRDLGGDIQLVLTLRPYADLLSSLWQQGVQNGGAWSYAEWLEEMLPEESEGFSTEHDIWRRFRLDHVFEAWGRHVGEENITVVVLDPRDRSMLLETFDRLLDLPVGTLAPDPLDRNVSFPHPEMETMRRFNTRFVDDGNPPALFPRSVGAHGLPRLKRTASEVMTPHPIVTPTAAAERMNGFARDMADAVRRSDVRVIGDLDDLVVATPAEHDAPETPEVVSVESAAEFAYAMFLSARDYVPPAVAPEPTPTVRPAASAPSIRSASGRELLGELRARVGRRLRR